MASSKKPLQLISIDEWIELATACGWPMDKSTFTALLDHDILWPIADDAMSPLQLLALDRYWHIVSRPQHAWSEPSRQSKDLVSYLNWYKQAHQHIESLTQNASRAGSSRDWFGDVLAQWFVEHELFPSPLAALVPALDPAIVSTWTGRARLWTVLISCQREMVGAEDATITTRTTMRTTSADPLGLRRTAEIDSPFEKPGINSRTTLSLESLSREEIPPKEDPSEPEEGVAPIRVTAEMDAVTLQTERFADRQSAVTSKTPSLPEALKADRAQSVRAKPRVNPTLELKQRLSQLQPNKPVEPIAPISDIDEVDEPVALEQDAATTTDAPSGAADESSNPTGSTPPIGDDANALPALNAADQDLEETQDLEQGVESSQDAPSEASPSTAQAPEHPSTHNASAGEVNKASEDPETSESSEGSSDDVPELDPAETEVVDDAKSAEPPALSDDKKVPASSGPPAKPPSLPPLRDASERVDASKAPDETPPTDTEEPPAADDTPSKVQLAAQIKTLNQKREQYMRAQNWEGLVALYEDGITLFGEKDRPQIYTTLSKLYDVKLKNPERAFANMVLAYGHSPTSSSARAQYEQHIHRLGQHAAVHDDYRQWLSDSLSSDHVTAATQLDLTARRARLDQSAGNVRQGFLGFAALLSESSTLAATPSALETLDELGDGLAFEELDAIYEDLYVQAENDQHRAALAQHAGLSALERDVNQRAIYYLKLACAIDSTNDAAFHSLASVCEEEHAWHQLVELYSLRLQHEPERTVLQDRLNDYRQKMLESPESALTHYQAQLDASPDDVDALDRLIDIYMHQQRHGELYGLLNRHMERVSSLDAKVHTLYALASIANEHLYAPEEAAVHYSQVLELSSGQLELIEQLIERASQRQLWSVAADAIDALTTDKEIALDSTTKISWLLRGAEAAVSSNRLRDRRRFLENVLALDPSHKDAMRMLQE